MNNEEKVKLLSGITDFSYYKYENFPDVNCYNYYENYVEHINGIVKKESNSIYKNRKLHFKFINHFNVNGSAFINNGEDYVYIYEGSQNKIYCTFNELIIKGAFKEYTNIKEVVSTQINLDSQGVTEQQFMLKIPLDYTAKLLSEYLSMFAMKFVMLHELGHHINGHLLYIKEQYGYTGLENNQVTVDIIKTLEMDADAFAISQLVREFKDIVQNDNKFGNLLFPNEIKLGLLIFSLHTLFIILEEENESNSDKLNRLHLSGQKFKGQIHLTHYR